MGSGLGHAPLGESCTVRRAGSHHSLGTVLSAAASSHTARDGAGGRKQFICLFSWFGVGYVRPCFLIFLCCWQDNAGNRMKGFKYLLQAAEAGDRSSMIIVARAFDSGMNLSADRSVK